MVDTRCDHYLAVMSMAERSEAQAAHHIDAGKYL